jgi:hypothetical protein
MVSDDHVHRAAVGHGRRAERQSNRRKLTDRAVIAISQWARDSHGVSQRRLASIAASFFNVSVSVVIDVLRGDTFRWVN